MPELTLQTAVSIANQVFADHGLEYPWSFVAVPSGQPAELKLRLIHVGTEFEMSARVSYQRMPHSFYAECSRALAGMLKVLRQMVERRPEQLPGMGKPVTEVGA
jgi:hypothetical protein